MAATAKKTTTPKPSAADAAAEKAAKLVRLREEIATGIERVRSLVEAENADGVKVVKEETEEMIGQLPTRERTALRATLAAAASGEDKVQSAPKAEVVKPEPKAEVVIAADTDEIAKLVDLGVQKVIEVARAKFGGGAAVAQIIFDGRLRVTKDGVPDLKADTQAAKDISADIFKKVEEMIAAHAPEVGDDEEADAVRSEVNSIRKSSRNAMEDVKVTYARALDLPTDEAAAERALFAGVLLNEDGTAKDGKASELVAAHFGFKLSTRAELAAEKRALKALEAAKAVEGEDGEGEDGEDGGTETVEATEADKLKAAAKKVAKDVKPLDVEKIGDLDDDAKKAVREDLQKALDALKAAIAATL